MITNIQLGLSWCVTYKTCGGHLRYGILHKMMQVATSEEMYHVNLLTCLFTVHFFYTYLILFMSHTAIGVDKWCALAPSNSESD